MNWITTVRGVLGRFWSWLFDDRDFILGVQKVFAFFGNAEQIKLHNNLIINDIDDTNSVQDCVPRPLYIDVASIGHVPYSIDEILGDAELTFDSRKENKAEWIATLTDYCGTPYMLTDHVVDYNVALFSGIDFKTGEKQLIFRVDPQLLNLRNLTVVDSSGNLRVLYVIYAWYRNDTAEKDPITGLVGSGNGGCSPEVWRLRHEGATVYNTKSLLAKATGSVISDSTGTVEDIWVEQGYRHVMVSGRIYSAREDVVCRVSVGDTVQIGDILFGNLHFFYGFDDIPAAEVPGILVTTDFGGLIATNETLEVENNILPLVGATEKVNAYKQEMSARNGDPNCPKTTLPTAVNPLKYITQAVRRGRSCVAVVSADNMQNMDPVLKALRDNTCASSLVSVVVKTAIEEPFNALTLQSTTTVGNGAVAVSVTPLEANNSISTEVWK